MRTLKFLGVLALGLAISNCGGGNDSGGPSPVPGFLKVVLTTPNADDGAFLVKVQGGTIDSVVGGAAVASGSYTIQPTFTRFVVAGNLVAGVIAKIHVPDVADHAAYTATIEQVAVRNTFAQRALTGYGLTVTQ
jgi:hypothetical protein